MNGLIEIFRIVLIGFAVLFALGWVAFFCLLLRRLFAVLFAGSELRFIVHDSRLLFLRRFLIRVWCGALITGILLIVLDYLGEGIPRR